LGTAILHPARSGCAGVSVSLLDLFTRGTLRGGPSQASDPTPSPTRSSLAGSMGWALRGGGDRPRASAGGQPRRIGWLW
jgi:hypothetical protein